MALRPACLAAARGILPLPQNDLFEVLVLMAVSEDKELSENAANTLSNMDESVFETSVRSEEIAESVLSYIAHRDGFARPIYEGRLVNPKTPVSVVETLASPRLAVTFWNSSHKTSSF